MADVQAIRAAEPTRSKGKSAAAFRTISEVATALDVPQHVLRFWETRFPQIKPLKRGGGRRYYRPEDVTLLHDIRRLLYSEGYTIKGVQRLMREGSLKAGRGIQPEPEKIVQAVPSEPIETPVEAPANPIAQVTAKLPEDARGAIHAAIAELEDIRSALLGNGDQRHH
jgi:DNA-binding transcriptional MerR regulator